jgi:hypothetical protein
MRTTAGACSRLHAAPGKPVEQLLSEIDQGAARFNKATQKQNGRAGEWQVGDGVMDTRRTVAIASIYPFS